MTPRDLNRLLHAASDSTTQPAAKDRSASVWQSISLGWDPERIEWQCWLRRWWPWAVLSTAAATAFVIEWPHGRHATTQEPPALRLFQEAAATPGGPS